MAMITHKRPTTIGQITTSTLL